MSDTKNENWRDVPGWIGFYAVSDLGRVRSLTRFVPHARFGPTHLSRYTGRVLKPSYSNSGGYAMVSLVETGRKRRQSRYIHDLVLEAFVGPKPPDKECCHGEEGGRENALRNLRYDTRSANGKDTWRFGRRRR